MPPAPQKKVSSSKTSIAQELKATLMLAFPIIGGQLAQSANGFVDTVMAGKVGATDLAAVALGSSIWIPVYLFLGGVLMATTPTVAQLAGANQEHKIKPYIHQAFWLALALGAIAWLTVRESYRLLPIMEVEPALWDKTGGYLAAVSWGLPAIAFFVVLRCFTEGLSHTTPVLVTSLLGLLVNIPINYIFIYGKFGLPALGGVGCGWATAIVMWLMLFMMIAYSKWSPLLRQFSLYSQFSAPKIKLIKSLLTIGFPIGMAIFFEVSIFSFIALLIGSLGVEIVAAHQVALNFSSLIFMLPLSLSMALTVRVGTAIGRADREAVKFTCQVGLGFAVLLAVIIATTLVLTRPLISSLYTDNLAVRAVAVELLLFAAIFQISDGLQVNANGILRGFKDTTVPMFYTLIAYWIIGLPTGYALGMTPLLGEPLGAKGFWIGLVLGLTLAAIMLCTRLYRTFQNNRFGPLLHK